MPDGDAAKRPARRLFAFSLLYLFLLFAVLLAEWGFCRNGGMTAMAADDEGVRLTEAQLKRRRARSMAMALALGAW